ncbi:MAG: hypothetical protein HWE27_14360 [Gammaproteobacteria bacterium]|nr:hypothetical protein [Gammaproteobacteria bacterium]
MNNLSQILLVTILSVMLCACDLSISNSHSSNQNNSGKLNAGAGAPTFEAGDCNANTAGVNWDALMDKNCPRLSDYNLFKLASDPTAQPNSGGVPYDLSVQLFTDYATKYRFVFIPENVKANFNESEVLDFPVGTVLVKTFAMPENTAFRDGPELIIETRLLIHRPHGWVALPYYWNPDDNGTDAELAALGVDIPNMSTIHNGANLAFTYTVPDWTACTSCHAKLSSGVSTFIPIGPKARYLNKDYTYDNSYTVNQLMRWAEGDILEGLPVDTTTVMETIQFNDSLVVSALTNDELNDAAKAYLDINCAHCHRSELTLGEGYSGPAGSSGLQVEYNREYAADPTKFGTCKVAVAGGAVDYPYDVIPTDAARSYLLFRMNTNDPRHRMPELGRATVHQEGVELIEAWINNLPVASCSPQ